MSDPCALVRPLLLDYSYERLGGRLFLADGHCADMERCIRLFEAIDPSVKSIDTFSGDAMDTLYRKIDGEWRAFATKPTP